MIIIGVDYHPSFQTIAFLMEETGEYGEQELKHGDGEAERFYRELKEKGVSVRVGMEATGHARWFERLLAELGFELWIGDPAEIKTKRVCEKVCKKKRKKVLTESALLEMAGFEVTLEARLFVHPSSSFDSRNVDCRECCQSREAIIIGFCSAKRTL